MTKTQYQRIKKIISKLEDEALNEGVDITSSEFQSLIEKLLRQKGFTLAEYQEMEGIEEKTPKISIMPELTSKELDKTIIEAVEKEKNEREQKQNELLNEIQRLDNKVISWEDLANQPYIPQLKEIQVIAEKETKKIKIPKELTEKDIKRIVNPLIPEQIDNTDQIYSLKWQIEEDVKRVEKKIPKIKDRSKELEKLQKDLKEYILKAMPSPKGRVSDKGGRFYNWGMPDKGSYGTAIPDSRYYKKAEVDALIAVENLWDRSDSTLTPHTANDSINIGSGTITTTGTGRFDGGLYDNAGTPLLSIDIVNRKLYDSYGDGSVDWENWQLQFGGAPIFDWSTSQVFDSVGNLALDFSSRLFYAADGTDVILDFNTAGLADFKDSNLITTGDLDVGKIILANNEEIQNATDDMIDFVGAGGTTNQTLRLDLDDALGPKFTTTTGTWIRFGDMIRAEGTDDASSRFFWLGSVSIDLNTGSPKYPFYSASGSNVAGADMMSGGWFNVWSAHSTGTQSGRIIGLTGYGYSAHTGTGVQTGEVIGGDFIARQSSDIATPYLIAVKARPYAQNLKTGAVAQAYGVKVTDRDAEDAVFTNAYGVWIDDSLSDGGSVVNNYGLYIKDQDEGTSLNYAIYSEGGDVELTDGNLTTTGTGRFGDLFIGAGTKHDGYIIKDAAEVQTTDATQTTIDSITLLDENTYHIEVWVIGVKSDGSQRASYHIAGTVYRTGAGNATIQGQTSLHEAESDANWDATFTVNGNDLRVSVTGKVGDTVEWGCTTKYINMSN